MEAYLRVFINLKQNNWAKLLTMAKFVYNNTKNASIGHTLFKLNYGFYSQVFFKENVDSRSKFYLAKKLVDKLKKLIEIYC